LRDELRANGFESLDILYETGICGSMDDLVRSVAAYLGAVVVGPPVSGLARMLPQDLGRKVSNPEALLDYCERCPDTQGYVGYVPGFQA